VRATSFPHQPGLPLAPRGRAGGQAVGFGEGAEQLQGAPVRDGLGHPFDGRRVVEVAPCRRRVGEEEVQRHELGQGGDVAGGNPMRVAIPRIKAMPTSVWSPG